MGKMVLSNEMQKGRGLERVTPSLRHHRAGAAVPMGPP